MGGVLAAGHWRAEIPREEPAQRIKTVILVTLARPPWGAHRLGYARQQG
ncbi:hypothetical protein HMPREF0742_02439 [Rothia aeria F0184]|uniref:Uncharacterized protein n=1 Tax=Rothia aeria F0184 TaxID=888019 RepID=U7UYT6_9MICC|nr:hypothetical protein HMPREF0742_02439 [Rothia aeria F0184]